MFIDKISSAAQWAGQMSKCAVKQMPEALQAIEAAGAQVTRSVLPEVDKLTLVEFAKAFETLPETLQESLKLQGRLNGLKFVKQLRRAAGPDARSWSAEKWTGWLKGIQASPSHFMNNRLNYFTDVLGQVKKHPVSFEALGKAIKARVFKRMPRLRAQLCDLLNRMDLEQMKFHREAAAKFLYFS